MSTLNYAVLCLLALAIGFSIGSSDRARLQDNQTDIDQVSINLTVSLPPPSKWVSFDCSVAGTFQVPPGQRHLWTIPSDTQAHSCNVTWGHSAAFISAYDANYDAGHATVFWSIKLDGFFHSWDNLNWVKKASWEH